ncbi:MAG: polysaccharide pyruvyl transferase family protein [Lentisphaeria bacterium]|nr:polysaccharide pyruvyl transferase family protein [Lentisphaeria bacterium]
MKARIKLYYHTGSGNHGCEAIVRATRGILDRDLVLYSFSPEQDCHYGLDHIVDVQSDTETPLGRKSVKYLLSAVQIKMFGQTTLNTRFRRQLFYKAIHRGDVYLSIGGDNYCYRGVRQLADYNRLIHKRGAKTVLWGCSIEPEVIENCVDDLNRYDLIIARESLTFDALKKAGVTTAVKQCPDPAFQLQTENCSLPSGFKEKQTVGLNLSPLVMDYGDTGLIIKNFEKLIQHIIETTDYQIALIPHVVKDTAALEPLRDRFSSTRRVILLDDCSCPLLKGFISRCRFFMGARTHSTIAAYSTCVPTIAIGYSMKARGIAKDIFGQSDKYVLPVQRMTRENELIEAFEWLQDNEESVSQLYNQKMPGYRAEALNAKRYLDEALNGWEQ